MTIGLIAVFIGIIIIDLPVILGTNKIKKTTIVYFSILLISFVLSLLQIHNQIPPSPSDGIATILDIILK